MPFWRNWRHIPIKSCTFVRALIHSPASSGRSAVAPIGATSSATNVVRESSNRLVHIIAEKRTSLSELLRSQVASADVDGLIRLGAVYRRRRGDLSERVPHASVDAERVLMNVDVSPGDYVRVHLSPRRYSTDRINWAAKVVYEDDDFVVVNKPSGLPSVPTGDNYLENVLYCMERHLKIPKLYSTHRLDTDTSGLILLGKTPEFASTVSRLMRDGHVRKFYRTLVAVSTEMSVKGLEGSLVHYTPVESRPLPKLFLSSASAGDGGWRRCEARVLEATRPRRLTFDQCCSEIWPSAKLEEMNEDKLYIALENYFKLNRKRYSSISELVFVDAQLELITGRTHQVRGQIHALESPSAEARPTTECDEKLLKGRSVHVAGDNMYRGPSSHVSPDSKYMGSPFLALQASGLEFRYRENRFCFSLPQPWWGRFSQLLQKK